MSSCDSSTIWSRVSTAQIKNVYNFFYMLCKCGDLTVKRR